MKWLIRIGSRTVPLWLLLIVSLIISVFAASVIFGVVDIGYRITLPGADVPTLTPGVISLNLGDIPSGSFGSKDFDNVATLEMPAGYEITFTLDLATVGDFDSFDVYVYLYRPGETIYAYSFMFWKSEYYNYDSRTVSEGTYDVYVEVAYTAVTVTSETTGTVKIDVSFPG